MKITIDEKVCLKYKLKMEEVLMALTIRHVKNPLQLRENMKNREIIVNTGPNNEMMVTQHWSDILDEILADSSGACKKTTDELLTLAGRIQECFPKMAQPDKYGRPTKYFFRCNKREIMLSLKRFYEAYWEAIEDITDNDIVDATKRYVASFKGDYRMMRLSKYFIFKNDRREDEEGHLHVEQISDLMTFLENKEEEDIVEGGNGWTTKMI